MISKARRMSAVDEVRYFRNRQWFDRILAALLLIPALPMIGVLIVLVRFSSKGPGLYRQVRVGLNDRPFTMYKIRSMRVDAEQGTGAVWCQKRDPRITRIGQVLRTLHLDELPQLFNVLRGEMALVGPRPERPEITPKLASQIAGYDQRHMVRPGITGLAQINLPADTDIESVRRKLALDMHYIRTADLWLDLRIILCTALKAIGVSGIRSAVWLGIRREPAATVVEVQPAERMTLLENRVRVPRRQPCSVPE